MKEIIAVAFLLCLSWFVASPYVTVYQMKVAADNQDGEAISEHIEFPTLRQNFKDQFNILMATEMTSEIEDNPFAAFGAAFGKLMVHKMVDAYVTPAGITAIMKAYVTPAGITAIMKGEKPEETSETDSAESVEEKEIFENAEMSYETWNKFAIVVPSDTGDEEKFILRRRGIGWKLTNIVLPLND
jgi:hypothetical protein